MRIPKLNSPALLFAVVVAVGIIASIWIQRNAVLGDSSGQSISLSNSQDKLLAQRNDLSKWLLGLAFATLVGLMGLQMKQESHYRPADSFLSMTAAGLLITSIFGAFLFQEDAVEALEKDIQLIYGAYLEAPLQIQFYTLLAALVLLAIWVLRPAKSITLLGLLLLLALPGTAQQSTCIEKWAVDRKIELPADARQPLESLIGTIRSKSEATVSADDECTYVASVADQLRGLAREENPNSDAALAQLLKNLETQANAANALPGDWISRLVEGSKIWRPVPHARLEIRSSPEGLQIRLKGEPAGWTNWVNRVRPGEYSLELLRYNRVVYSEHLILADGSQKVVEYPKK